MSINIYDEDADSIDFEVPFVDGKPKFSLIHARMIEDLRNVKLSDQIYIRPFEEMHLVVETLVFYLGSAKYLNVRFGYDGCGGYWYRYKQKWYPIEADLIKYSLGKAAEVMGVDFYTAQYYQFKNELLKQYECDTYNCKINSVNNKFGKESINV